MEFRNNRNNSSRRRLAGADFEPAGFLLLRTPLLPFDELEAWGANLRAPCADPSTLAAALEEDRRELRAWLRDFLTRPDVLEALYVASPPLLDALDVWRADPDSKKGLRAEEALVRYAVRMASRATPFGLFAGCTVGRAGEDTRLRLGDSLRRHSRLDMDYLVWLAHELNQDRALRRSFRWFPNTSLYRAAGRLRYAEARLDGRIISYHLVAVGANEFLEAALARARHGASLSEVAAAVMAGDPDGEIDAEDAESFVDDLIDSQLLVSDFWPALTGPEAVHSMIEGLARIGHPGAAVLGAVHQELRTIDAQGLGHAPERYRDVARRLEEALPKRDDNRYLYHVDLFKDGQVVLGDAVMDEIARSIELLCRLSGSTVTDPLEAFREKFLDRYGEGRLVPLVEVLDDELGIGLPSVGTGSDASPLLAGFTFPAGKEIQKIPWGRREEFLLEKLTAAMAAGSPAIEITEEELAPFEREERRPLPDGFQAMVGLAAASEEAIAAGDYRLRVRGFFGPSGARIAGRFCHGDRALMQGVLDHLRAEESLDPDVVFAEVVHLPTGRVGNISSRPLLRAYEIPFLGVSGAPRDRQIPIDDLFLTMAGGEVRLISKRLGKRVMPRITSAHNFAYDGLALYHFLGMLQDQGLLRGLVWSWGVLARLPYLPRLCIGRLVLSPAHWRIAAGELAEAGTRRGADRFLATRRWREQRGIPRQVLLDDGDNELFIDFENVLSLESFFAHLRKYGDATVNELWPAPAELPVTGPGGRFISEFMVPFERRREPTRRRAAPRPAEEEVSRVLTPASQWLYLKIYTGAATADLVLRDVVAPLVERAIETGAADRWFFLRYGDPHWHLRVRFGGDAQRLQALVGAIGEQLEPELREGRIWRWQLDTYEREIERYGGPAGIELAERIFHADSEAVLAALGDLAGDEGAEARWRLALVGIDRLLDDFGCDPHRKRDVLAAMRASFAAEHEAGSALNQQLARRLRDVRDELEELLAAETAVFTRRSERLQPLIAELRAREARGELTSRVDDMIPSFVHMFVNRLIRSDARAHELVLYDFLHRLIASRIAREVPKSPAPDPMPARAD